MLDIPPIVYIVLPYIHVEPPIVYLPVYVPVNDNDENVLVCKSNLTTSVAGLF